MEISEKGAFNLISATVAHCFMPYKIINYANGTPSRYNQSLKIKNERIKFANSKLFEIWVDCSYNFEIKRLRKLIEKKQDELMDNALNEVRSKYRPELSTNPQSKYREYEIKRNARRKELRRLAKLNKK